jgi:IS30 family transposase
VELRVSHETIYQSLYVQGRGALRAELHQALRSGRAIRKPQARSAHKRTSRIPDMVLISERPAEVEDRAVPGHWEGDLIVGSKASSIGTLVERQTRFVMLLKLGNRTAEEVRRAMTTRIRTLPAELRRSVTLDQGNEMALHRDFTIGHWDAGLLLRPEEPLAARIQREHQRTFASVLPEGNRSPGSFTGRAQSRRSPAQWATPRDA